MAGDADRLESWKQIAAYLGRSQRTVRRWHETEGLPVHKHQHLERGTVWAYPAEIDEWLQRRKISPTPLAEELNPAHHPPAPEETAPSSRSTILSVALGLAIGAYWVLPRSPQASSLILPEPVALTALPGKEMGPAISPDGRQIAFFGDGPQQSGIYLKTMGSEELTLLVAGGDDFVYSPVWSPDGGTIAYLRRTRKRETWLWLTGPRGGTERRLVRLHDRVLLIGSNRHLSWSQDGKRILAPVQYGLDETAISWIRVSDGAVQQVTEAAMSAHAPALSPAGRTLVYLRNDYSDPANAQFLLRQDLKPDGTASGPPLELFHGPGLISGVGWLPDSENLVLCKAVSGFDNPQLYRMQASPGARLTPIVGSTECTGLAVFHSNVSGKTFLVFGRNREPRLQLWTARTDDLQNPVPFAPSSRSDQSPSFSPDGRLVAFGSSRSGTNLVWVADREGNQPHRLSNLPFLGGSIEWSPDGKQLLFGSRQMGLAVVPLNGGDTTTIKVGAAPIPPHWSHGSGFVYYPSGNWLYRMRPDGRDRIPMFEIPREIETFIQTSPDGRFIYRVKKEGLLRHAAVPGGDEELIEPNLMTSSIAATRTALYYVRKEDSSLYALPFAGGPARKMGVWRLVGGRGGNMLHSFTVSPDDRTVLWCAGIGQDIDLEMVDFWVNP